MYIYSVNKIRLETSVLQVFVNVNRLQNSNSMRKVEGEDAPQICQSVICSVVIKQTLRATILELFVALITYRSGESTSKQDDSICESERGYIGWERGVTIDTRLTFKFLVSKTPTTTVFLLAKLEYIVSIILQVLDRKFISGYYFGLVHKRRKTTVYNFL